MSTLLLTRADVVRHLDALPLLEALREAWAASASRRTGAPHRPWAHIPDQGTASVSFPGCSPDIPAWTVKIQTRTQAGAADGTGVLHLYDARSGALLAVMESGHLTALGTGLTGALSVEVLARKEASNVALIGAGPGASTALRCLRLVRSLSQVRVFDADVQKAGALARRTFQSLSLPSTQAPTVEEAVSDADIVLVTCPAPEGPAISPAMLRPACHVVTLGVEPPTRTVLDRDLVQAARVFCDDRTLAVSGGPLGALGPGGERIEAELGELLAGRAQARRTEDELTVFCATGAPLQDLIVAWSVYEGAQQDEGIQRIELGAP